MTRLKSEIALKYEGHMMESSDFLDDSVPPNVLQMLSMQSKMISVLAQEVQKNRELLRKHDLQINKISRQMTFFDLAITEEEKFIDSSQVDVLKKIVRKKSRNRQQTMRIWSAFKHYFMIKRYTQLPRNCFLQAVDWLKKWE